MESDACVEAGLDDVEYGVVDAYFHDHFRVLTREGSERGGEDEMGGLFKVLIEAHLTDDTVQDEEAVSEPTNAHG